MKSREYVLLLAVLAPILTAAFAFTPGPRIYFDGNGLVTELYKAVPDNPTLTRQFLILPTAAFLRDALSIAPENALILLCAITGALTPLLVYAGLRWLGFRWSHAGFAALMLGFAPGMLFFATNVEKHGPHACAIALAFALACRGAFRSRVLSVIAIVASIVLILGTHNSGILRYPFLAMLGIGCATGVAKRAYWLTFVLGALGCITGFLLVLGVNFEWWTVTKDWPLHQITVNFVSKWDLDPRSMPSYFMRTFLEWGRVLTVCGLAGLLLLIKRIPRIGWPMLLWFFADLYAYTAYDHGQWVKSSGHVLATYVALAVGTAELIRFTSRNVPGLLAILAAALGLQLFFGLNTIAKRMDEPHPLEWVASLRKVTGEQGILLTTWNDHYHQTEALLHTKLNVISVATVGQRYSALIAFPPEDWQNLTRPELEKKALTTALTEFRLIVGASIESGTAVYLDRVVETHAEQEPRLVPVVDELRTHFLWQRIGDGIFEGWRLRANAE